MKRSATLRILSTLLLVMLTIVAVACGGGEPAPSPTAPPAPPPPTATPVSPTPTPPPTATPVPPAPTPEEVGLLFEYVEYVHPSGVFRIEYPEDWEVVDNSGEGNVVMRFSSTETFAFVTLALVDMGMTVDEETLNGASERFLGAGFGANPDYQELGRETYADGSLRVSFSYTETDVDETIHANTFFEYSGSIISALTIGSVEDEWDSMLQDFNYLINTYSIDETAWPY